MRSIRSHLGAFLALLAALSCSRGTYSDDTSPGKQDQTGQVALRVAPDTKSVLPSALETAVKSLLVVICRDDDPSQWKCMYQQGDAQLVTLLQLNVDYTAYAFVNMGNVLSDIPRTEGGALDFSAFYYTIDHFEQLKEDGFPMAGKIALSREQVALGKALTIDVDRLMAKVQVNVDGVSMDEGKVYMRNVARTLYPFAAEEDRRARSLADIFQGDTDWDAFQGAQGMSGHSQTLVFYVPENCQGQLLSTRMQWLKSADYMDDEAAALCTYLEFQALRSGDEDGISGPVIYRCYLGGNVTDDFSLTRNSTYLAQLSLTWDGLFSGQTWRIDASGLTDERRLRLSSQTRILDPCAADLGKVKRGKTDSLYVNYSRDAGSSWVDGAKDVNTWPYGWNLYIDGVLQPAGFSGTASGDIGWAYSSGASGDLLEITPGPTAVLKSTHTVQLVTADGQLASNGVRFQVEQPFTSRWCADAIPHFVAQRGLLECIEPDTGAPSAEGVFHSAQPDKIRITDNGDGTAYISLLAPFEADSTAVYMTDAEGDRRCNVTLESLLPYFACSDLRTCYLDESAPVRFAYFKDAQREQMLQLRARSAAPACGDLVDAELAAECMPPQTVSVLGKLGFDRSLASDGSFFLRTYVSTYAGLSPSGTSFEVDRAQLSMGGYPSRGQHSTVFRAYNPWAKISGLNTGVLLNDYTLYCEPGRNMPYTGWQSTPSAAPQESTNYTKLIYPTVVANVQHLSFATRFLESGQSLGIICSGTPGRVSPDCLANHWSLQVSVNPSLSSSSQEQLLTYFSQKGIAFISVADMMDALAQQGYSYVIGGAYTSQAAANQAQPVSAISGCTFTVFRNTSQYNWTLTYGMKGVQAAGIPKHSAGRFLVYLRLRNAHDLSVLEKPIMEAWMKLHLYLWPRAEGPLSGGRRFQASVSLPNDKVDGLPDYFRRGSGVLDVASSLSTAGGVATLVSGGETAAQMGSAATWEWDGGRSVENLGWGLSSCSPAPFTWKRASDLQNASPGCFERISDYVVQFDPSGSAQTYSYDGDKLFVFYLYTGSEPYPRPSFYVSP